MRGARSAVRRASAAATASFGGLTAVVGHEQGAPLQFLITDTGVGLVFVVAGFVAWRRRPEVRTGPILVASGALWFIGSYAPTSLTPWSVLGFAFERQYDVLLAFLTLTFPGAPLDRRGRLAMITLAAAYLARAASRLLVDCGCTAARHPFAVVDDPALFDQLQVWTSAVIVAASLAVVALAVLRLHTAAPVARRILWPVVVSGSVAALIAAYDASEVIAFVRHRQPLLPLREPWLEVISWTILATVALVPLGFLAGAWRLIRSRSSIARMAVELDGDSDPHHLRTALRIALGDPTLDLLLPDPVERWLSVDGVPQGLPSDGEGRVVTVLSSGAVPIAAVVHDPVLEEDPGLVAAANAVLRLAVENDRLSRLVLGQLEEVRASRARLVAAAEQERRRIERDLHDGAQQRLISVALSLQQAQQEARTVDPRASFVTRLDDASAELVAAIDELRELARGIHPAILSEEGLRPAVASLARRCSVPVELDVELDGRLDPPIETAAYYIVAEGLTNVVRHARARTATVRVIRENGHLAIEIGDDGDGGADEHQGSGLRGIADRLDALSGSMEVESVPGAGTRLRASIPCG